jgi:hypothetical protein
MTEISAGQMKLLHVLCKESGISHDELSASAKRSYRVSSLKDLSFEQAGEMIDGLTPAEAKPVAPPKPQHYRFPRLPFIGPKPAATVQPPRPAAPAVTAPARRPFGAKPPINPPVPKPVVKPEPVRIRLPSDPPRPAAERQTGGFGKLLTPEQRATTRAAGAPKHPSEFQHRYKDPEGLPLTPDDIPW